MGNTCGTSQGKELHTHKRMNMDPTAKKHGNSNSKFKFMLNDEDLMISPSSITNDNSIITPSSTTAHSRNNTNNSKFTFDNVDPNDNPLDFWVRQLTHDSNLSNKQDSDHDISQQVRDDITIMTTVIEEKVYDNGDNHTQINHVKQITITRPPLPSQSTTESDVNLDIKPHLYRPNTMSKWDSADLEEKEKEMKEQLNYLELEEKERTPSPNSKDDNLNTFPENKNINDNLLGKRPSKLMLTASQTYDTDMEDEENQMKKQLLHLKDEHSKHSNHDSEVHDD